MLRRLFFATAGLALLALSPPAKADIITSLGNTASGFANDSHQTSAAIVAALSGSPAPFNLPCGSDASANCSATWTFNYTVPVTETVSGATITLGIYDIDSAAPGDQVASYTLSGGDDLTAALNTLAEGINGDTGSANSEFDIFTVTIPSTSFAVLDSGTAEFSLALQGPGLGALGDTTYNGAALIFSTLDLQTTPVSSGGGGGGNLPEPGTLALMLSAMGMVAAFGLRRRTN